MTNHSYLLGELVHQDRWRIIDLKTGFKEEAKDPKKLSLIAHWNSLSILEAIGLSYLVSAVAAALALIVAFLG